MADPLNVVQQLGRDVHHPDLVNGNPVAYAGMMRFRRGQIIRWDNGSGHYQPNPTNDPQESECIRQLLEGLPEWNFGSVPVQSPYIP